MVILSKWRWLQGCCWKGKQWLLWGEAQTTDPERSLVKGQPSRFTDVNTEAVSARIRDVPGSHVSWYRGRIQLHSSASFHEKVEKWVCFLRFYRVTEGEAPEPTQLGPVPNSSLPQP